MGESINRHLALYGAAPRGKKIASKVARNDVRVVTSLEHLYEITAYKKEGEYSRDHGHIGSIVVIVCPGDELTVVSGIYSLATELKILVTAIIVTDSGCKAISHSESLNLLRKSSDSVVITSDETYLQYMLECVLYE
jgi:hypothetical protein